MRAKPLRAGRVGATMASTLPAPMRSAAAAVPMVSDAMSATPEDDDPWAPLPADQLWQRPGEEHMFSKRPERVSSRGKARPEDDATSASPTDTPADAAGGPAATVPPRVVPSPKPAPKPASLRPTPPLDPAAAQALAALQQKLAAAPPGQSLVSESQRREDQAVRRKRAVAGPVAPELAALHVQGRDPEAEPALEYAPGADGRDPREEEAWFAALPPAERERLHAQWAKARAHGVDAKRNQRRRANRRFVAALAIAAATVFAGTGYLWHVTIGAGLLTGLWWRRAGADRFLDPIRALACLVVAHAAALLQTGEPNALFWIDAILVVSLSALVGFDGEIKRTGGFDQR